MSKPAGLAFAYISYAKWDDVSRVNIESRRHVVGCTVTQCT